jgi:cellulose synthase/poly-beta-1,6-N-acetylglucosamine synthase-like glycosyltransferase
MPRRGRSGRQQQSRFRVIAVPSIVNRRLELLEGIKFATGDVIYLVDSTAIWPPALLSHTLACFEDPSVGGVGVSSRVEPVGPKLGLAEAVADFQFSTDNLGAAATDHIDGGSLSFPSSTAAYRTVILRDPAFIDELTHEYWRRSRLDSGEDKFLGRWLVDCGWKTRFQYEKKAEVATCVPASSIARYLQHVTRCSRDRWRSDLRSLFVQRRIWTSHPYAATTMLAGMLDPFAILGSPFLIVYLIASGSSSEGFDGWTLFFTFFIWIHALQTLESLPLLFRNPRRIVYLPVWIVFSYLDAVSKFVALFSLGNVRLFSFVLAFVLMISIDYCSVIKVTWDTASGGNASASTSTAFPVVFGRSRENDTHTIGNEDDDSYLTRTVELEKMENAYEKGWSVNSPPLPSLPHKRRSPRLGG